ncbi:hypothetical protein [Sphingopyxis sp.]|uniref:hypothetical protein n=1 Tax=Sphingopyxis sp. TaxID=1908224 RepID=UPI002D77D9A2|nr:hypothetical protein [Sphingopyxis sp.]HET6525171.1 hypothetical protein [Sphingopyxis sp.]
MKFKYGYGSDPKHLTADVERFINFLDEHGFESVTNLQISCYPWRNGKRLQAVNAEGEIRPITFELLSGDDRDNPQGYQHDREAVTIRERPDTLGNFGLAALFNQTIDQNRIDPLRVVISLARFAGTS